MHQKEATPMFSKVVDIAIAITVTIFVVNLIIMSIVIWAYILNEVII